jgi:glucokinase
LDLGKRKIEMARADLWSIGVDLGGTKIEVAMVDAGGNIHGRLRLPTHSKNRPAIIKTEIISAIREIKKGLDS